MCRRIGTIGLVLCICSVASGQQATSPPSTRPTTSSSTTQLSTRPTTRAADPLETPESAVLYLLALLKDGQMPGIRTIMADKDAYQQLAASMQQVSKQMQAGATCEIVETKIEGLAAAVLYRTTYPNKREEIVPVMLIRQYAQWKPLLGKMNPRRFSDAELADLKTVTAWEEIRLKELSQPTDATR